MALLAYIFCTQSSRDLLAAVTSNYEIETMVLTETKTEKSWKGTVSYKLVFSRNNGQVLELNTNVKKFRALSTGERMTVRYLPYSKKIMSVV